MREYRYEINERKYRVRIKELYGDHAVVEVNDQIYHVAITQAEVPEPARPTLPIPAPAIPSGPVASPPSTPARPPAAGAGGITSPMPGVILKVLVSQGDMVNAGDVVMSIEAMKMENDIKAPKSGTVQKIMVGAGESVNTGQLLMEIE